MPKASSKPVQLFLSYSVKDKEFATDLKDELERLGPVVFLAHQDISPSLEWQSTILKKLKTIDVFIPIVTNKFLESYWTDQESGVALAYNRFILPAAIDQMPYGFIGRF